MQIQTQRFGKIEIDESKIIHFVSEILGFPRSRRYVLIPHRPGSPFFWLQSLEEPDLAFVVTVPRLFFPDYSPELPPEILKKLRYREGEVLDYLVIVYLPKDNPEEMTVNLLGPIAVNVDRKLALQVVLDPNRYSVSEPLKPRLRETSPEAGVFPPLFRESLVQVASCR